MESRVGLAWITVSDKRIISLSLSVIIFLGPPIMDRKIRTRRHSTVTVSRLAKCLVPVLPNQIHLLQPSMQAWIIKELFQKRTVSWISESILPPIRTISILSIHSFMEQATIIREERPKQRSCWIIQNQSLKKPVSAWVEKWFLQISIAFQ